MTRTQGDKRLDGIEAAFDACGIGDRAVLSFHHHLRNGDGVLNAVLDVAARRGLRGLRIEASSIFPVHAPMVGHIRDGVVRGISTAFMSGPVAEAVSRGALPERAVLRTHGGRARAILSGETPIDVAFVAAPGVDISGNITGMHGPRACGAMGYPMSDVARARHVVAISDHLMPVLAPDIQITGDAVNHVVIVDQIGDASGIQSGTTHATTDPVGLGIAARAAKAITASGALVDGFSFQTGAGGISIATAEAVGQHMRASGIVGDFALGGITGFHVRMLDEGLFRRLMDVQCFDLDAVRSFAGDPRHIELSAAAYASPDTQDAAVNALGAVVLGAAEVDLGFNVNVTTGADGIILGGSGGHADAAAGAALTVITTRLTAAGFAKLVPRVRTCTTPGASVDVIVTEQGIAVNPARDDLVQRLQRAGLPVVAIEDLVARAAAQATRTPTDADPEARIVAVSEYRDGTPMDVVRAVH